VIAQIPSSDVLRLMNEQSYAAGALIKARA